MNASGEVQANQPAAAAPPRRNFLRPAMVTLLAAAFFLESYTASLVKSPTWDEPFHIAAGLSYVETGRIVLNQQHPPLLKEISGLFLRAAGVPWPSTPEGLAAIGPEPGLAPQVGNEIIAANGPDRVMYWARLPFLLLSTACVFLLYLLGCRLVGKNAALFAVFLYAVDPNLIGHAPLVATDVGLAVFTVAFLLALWWYLERPGIVRLLVCGVALGLALGSKFSAVVLLPVVPLLLAAAAFWPIEQRSGGFRRALLRYGLGFAGMCAAAFAVLQYLYLFPSHPLQYIDGMRLVNADHIAGYPFYMAGHLGRRFYSYYALAYALKEPAAAVIAAALGLGVVLWKVAPRHRGMEPLAVVFLLLPSAALWAGYTLFSDDMGVRYIIPVLPFTFLLGGAGLAELFREASAWKRAAGGLLCAWAVVAAIGIYPDQLSYFNEYACLLDDPSRIGWDGGSRCGYAWLDDSNIDWAQGLKQLRSWLDSNRRGRPLHLGYFGSFPPENYGFATSPTDYSDVLSGAKPGLYAVSSQILARAGHNPGAGDWLLRSRPVAVVAHTFYIYEVP